MNGEETPERKIGREIDEKGWVVEEAVPETPSDEHSTDAVRDEIGRVGPRQENSSASSQPTNQPPGDEKTREIGKAVPLDRE